MTLLLPGRYKIVSLTKGHPSVGVDLTKLLEQLVHLNGRNDIWHVKKDRDPGVYLLGVSGYPHTEIGDKHAVIATTSPEENRKWIISHHQHHNAYTIEPVTQMPMLQGWTVADESPNALIVVKPIADSGSIPDKQLFRFEPIVEEE